jgi:putative membrane protein insertion efficiency factor
VLALIGTYKLVLSPLFAGSCRFHPSCASYAREAVERHGAWRGVALGAWRLARCHPFCKGGYAPVPGDLGPGWFGRPRKPPLRGEVR